MAVDYPDIPLMLQVRQGDEEAFELLYGRYQQQLRNFFYGLCRNPSIANDMCQETFLRVWRIRARYRATGSFPAYLFGIARLVWMEKCRELKKHEWLGSRCDSDERWDLSIDASKQPDALACRSELEGRIHGALDSLPEEQRTVFVLRTIKGLSLQDIASVLDCPVNTVRSRKILAVKKLRHLLSSVFTAETGSPVREGGHEL